MGIRGDSPQGTYREHLKQMAVKYYVDQGLSIETTANTMGYSRGFIDKLLTEAGVEKRSRGSAPVGNDARAGVWVGYGSTRRRLTAEEIDEMSTKAAELYGKDYTLIQIATRLGVGVDATKRLLKIAHVNVKRGGPNFGNDYYGIAGLDKYKNVGHHY